MKRFSTICGFILVVMFMTMGAAMAEKQGGTLTVARPTDSMALDPAIATSAPSAWVYFNILEPLLIMDHDMNIQYKLATSYKVLSPKKVRFNLRKNVTFHDGTPFNAEAVKFTFDKAYKSEKKARWAGLIGPFDRVDIIDDYTVDIVMKEPYGPMIRSLAMIYPGILSPTAVKKMGEDFARNPVGTGPFKFQEWKTNDHITLVRNEDYWGPKAHLDRLIFRVIPEESARMIALKTGEVDFIVHVPPSELSGLEKDKNFSVFKAVGLQSFHIGLNLAEPPLDDIRVRKAMAYAVNVDYILKYILEGAASPLKSYISPGVFGYKDMHLENLYPYDKEKAKALFAEAGWEPGSDKILRKNGKKLTLTHICGRGRWLKDAEVSEAVQAMLKEVGVEVNLQFQEWGSIFTQLRSPELHLHMFTLAWTTTNADADYSFYNLFYSKGVPPTAWNVYRYKNAQVDRLLDEARASLDSKKREVLYSEAQDLLARDVVMIPIYNSNMIYASGSYVKGFHPHPVEYNLGFSETWLDK